MWTKVNGIYIKGTGESGENIPSNEDIAQELALQLPKDMGIISIEVYYHHDVKADILLDTPKTANRVIRQMIKRHWQEYISRGVNSFAMVQAGRIFLDHNPNAPEPQWQVIMTKPLIIFEEEEENQGTPLKLEMPAIEKIDELIEPLSRTFR